MRTISGVWLPIITPFVDGAVDVRSYERLLEHYLGKGVSGVFPVGTTGESPALDDAEIDAIVERTVAVVAGRVPVFVGIGGNATHKVLKTLKRLARQRFDGIVSVCPYYNRPSQDGMLAHFTRIAEATDRPILIYNIPYRTSVNLANDTLLRYSATFNPGGPPYFVEQYFPTGNTTAAGSLAIVMPNVKYSDAVALAQRVEGDTIGIFGAVRFTRNTTNTPVTVEYHIGIHGC